MNSTRAGTYIKQLSGEVAYNAFIPKPLPPEPAICLDSELSRILSQADQAIGRLDGALKTIPSPDLFVYMYVRKEAVLSSQIEGTQASLSDILEKEDDILSDADNDVKATVNYIKAMDYGLKRIKEFPLSLRLIKEIHKTLLSDVRGKNHEPGEFRRSQNWIGPEGCTLNEAVFVPPPVHEMNEALGVFEKYLHAPMNYPTLIESGLIHAQFETIHPFLDGNGRVGRLLITFLLCLNNVISEPLLYLSYYFKKHKQEYYDRLLATRNEGDWEGWLKFFLQGIVETSDNAVELSNRIITLQKKNEELVHQSMPRYSTKSIELLNKIYVHPVFTVNKAKGLCGISYNTAKGIIQKFVDLGIVMKMSLKKRNQNYSFREYISLLDDETELR